MATVVCFGEILLRLGAPGHELLLQSPRLDVHVGGAEANVAVSLARLGHATSLAGTLSDNALGDAALATLRGHSVDVSSVRRAPGRMGLYFLATGAGHRPSRVLYDRAGSAFAVADAADYAWDRLLEGASWLHLSGVTPALGSGCAQAALAAARAARAAGVQVSFDGNFRASLWAASGNDPAPILRALLHEADLAFADHRDISVVLGDETAAADAEDLLPRAMARAFNAFPNLQRIATTLRTQHSVDHHVLEARMFRRDGQVVHAPPRELTAIVDRIGAGDAFAAGVLHGLLQGADESASVAYGLAAACLKHALPGDFNLVDGADIAALVDGARLDVRR